MKWHIYVYWWLIELPAWFMCGQFFGGYSINWQNRVQNKVYSRELTVATKHRKTLNLNFNKGEGKL